MRERRNPRIRLVNDEMRPASEAGPEYTRGGTMGLPEGGRRGITTITPARALASPLECGSARQRYLLFAPECLLRCDKGADHPGVPAIDDACPSGPGPP